MDGCKKILCASLGKIIQVSAKFSLLEICQWLGINLCQNWLWFTVGLNA